MKHVAVTGLGAISACGIGVESLWHHARKGKSGVRPVPFARRRKEKVGFAASFSPETIDNISQSIKQRYQDRVTACALIAAREAVSQSGLEGADFGPRAAAIVGSGFGGAETLERNYAGYMSTSDYRVDAMSVPKIMTNAPAAWVAKTFGATGPSYCVSTACSSSSQSIGLGATLIEAGIIDICIAGGSEALLFDTVFAAWEALHVMTRTVCRPFSKNRSGMVLGEGAAIVVLERKERARARGANILCEIAGYGTNCDGADLLRPDASNIAACMRAAIDDAAISPSEIAHVNAHGTGTIANDLAEAEALKEVFGEASAIPALSSTKPVHGHALGASGALEFILCVQALCEQLAPPTLNYAEFDPKIGFEPVSATAVPISGHYVLTNSLAFGGTNATLVIGSALDG